MNLMRNVLFIVFIGFLILSCKPSEIIKGKYGTHSVNGNKYEFDTNSHKFSYQLNSGKIATGKFKIIHLSPERSLIICNNLIFKKNRVPFKELNEVSDSVYIGSYSTYKNLGATIFEINTKDKNNLTFRKTYANQLDETDDNGNFILHK